MPSTDASVLTNMFADTDRLVTRAGYAAVATAGTLSSKTLEGFTSLMTWSGFVSGAATEYLFAAFAWVEDVIGVGYRRLRIYKWNGSSLTSSLADVGALSGTAGEIKSYGNWVNFTAGSGTTYLILPVNTTLASVDSFSVQAFDGSAWSIPAVTGVPGHTVGVHAHQHRLWFFNNPTKPLSAYYLPTAAIAGAVTEFNLGPFATKGGAICAMETWTRDGGVGGMDDLAVFVTTKGQALVYQGTDPSNLSTWALVGVYDLGAVAIVDANTPTLNTVSNVNRNNSYALKYGADVLFILESGVIPASRILAPLTAELDYSLSSKIRSLITVAAGVTTPLTLAWKLIFVPRKRMLVLNIPTAITTSSPSPPTPETVTSYWFVMNVETGAWVKYEGMSAWDLVVYQGDLHFVSGDYGIYKHSTQTTDNGTTITYEARQAYSNFDQSINKLFTLMQPLIRATGNFSLTAKADVDFSGEAISSYTSYTVASEQSVRVVASPGKLGEYVAAHLKGQTSVGAVSWYATKWAAKPGGIL